MTNYRKGRRLEWKARDYLRDVGFTVVRSAGSKTAIDLVAIKKTDIILIQVKAQGEADEEAIEKLRRVPCPAFVTKQVWEHEGGDRWNVIPVGKERLLDE